MANNRDLMGYIMEIEWNLSHHMAVHNSLFIHATQQIGWKIGFCSDILPENLFTSVY
jgi:hypothetical protein